MAKKNLKQQEQVEWYDKLPEYYEKYKTPVTAALSAFILIALGIIYFSRVYLPKQEEEAQVNMYQAQIYFEKDSIDKALNGDGLNMGFLEIYETYDWTQAANLASYYIGICYLKKGDYDKAIKYLKAFDSDDMVLSTLALVGIGDAYMEKGDSDKGISYYKDACENQPNEFITPLCLMKTARALEWAEKYDDAYRYYERLKKDYPKSREAAEVDKYLARLETKRQ